jgi:DNA-binding CsgD family transcriptional regulator
MSIMKSLQPYERRIAFLLMQGCSNREIGVLLKVTPRTVQNRTHDIYRKTGIRGRLKLAVSLWKERH